MKPDTLIGRDAAQTLEFLWPASLGVIGVTLGWFLIPVAIHLIGRGGQQETIEWALYMSLLVIYPPVVLLLSRGSQIARYARLGVVYLSLAAAVIYVLLSPHRLVSLALALAAGGVTVALTRLDPEFRKIGAKVVTLPALIAATFAWMSIGGLVSWGDASRWLLFRPQAAVALFVFAWCAMVVVREMRVDGVIRRIDITPIDWIAIAVLVVFSFRTFPIIEFYHWGFYIGPIEQMRQGGKLLWDTPSQYGLLSILLPEVVPGTPWESFWLFQSIVFAIVAAIMYIGIRKIGRGLSASLLAFAVVFTTLFFRPRSDSLLLSAQMTPSGGPVRFIPMFLLLAALGRWIIERDDTSPRRFVVGGSLIWTFALLWSAEAAIYCSAIWFAALAVYLLQSAFKWRKEGAYASAVWSRAITLLLMPLGMAVVAAVAVIAVYRTVAGRMPDLHGYIEYALLYSKGGFGALPIDPTGSVWFILLIFFAVTMAGALYLSSDPANKRLVMLAGLWGGVWSVGSYYTGRSHPVNVLSLAPILLFSAALMLRTIRSDFSEPWHEIVFAAIVPALAVPVVLTIGHQRALAELTRPQLAPSRIVDQVPAMDTSLVSLLAEEGVKPTDPVVLIGDGRLMLPAWKRGDSTVLADRSWLPKPYEIIGSLPATRRDTYIDRNRVTSPEGWLIHSKTDTIRGFTELHQKLLEGRKESRRLENGRWIVSWVGR